MNQQTLLTPSEVVALLKVPYSTLEYWRRIKTGPGYIRLGHRTVRYPLQGVQSWMQTQTTKQ